MLKTVRGGYDGRGVVIADDLDQAVTAAGRYLEAGVQVLIEERVALRRGTGRAGRALAVRSGCGLARRRNGAARRHLRRGRRPAPGSREVAASAQQLAFRLAAELGVVGVLAVELFESSDGSLLVNELAMRPHNSGHWTMDGSVTSQFEQHLRAVLDYPLGDTALIASTTVMANVLRAPQTPSMGVDERLHHLFARMPDAKVHLYGKAERAGRKLGHVNIVGKGDEDVAGLRERAPRCTLVVPRGVDGRMG